MGTCTVKRGREGDGGRNVLFLVISWWFRISLFFSMYDVLSVVY